MKCRLLYCMWIIITADLVSQGPQAYDSLKVHGTSPIGMTETLGSEPVLTN